MTFCWFPTHQAPSEKGSILKVKVLLSVRDLSYLTVNPCPSEHGYILPLQTV